MSAVPPPTIDSHAAFTAALAWGFQEAVAQGARRIVCCDSDFAQWAWDDAATLDTLGGWLRLPQRRLLLLAQRYDQVPRRWPRFNAWRRDLGHAISAWQPAPEVASTLPCLLVSDKAVCVHLIDAVHWRGRAQLDGRSARRWCEQIDAVLQRSESAYAVSTLGL